MVRSRRPDEFPGNLERKTSLPLKHRTWGFCLLAVYVPLITIPWILTCILARRPIGATSYTSHGGFSEGKIDSFSRWKSAVDVLNSIAGLITIPLLSALLAQAAVVFCQRTRPDQFLSVQNVFALADRAWTNPLAIWRSVRSGPSRSASKGKWAGSFLLPAAALIVLGALQQPLYQILVHIDTIAVTGCVDTRYQYLSSNASRCTETTSKIYKPIGVDMEPAQMDQIYHDAFLSRMNSDLVTVSLNAEQPHLWSDEMTAGAWTRSGSEWTHTPNGMYRSLRPWLPGFTMGDYELPRFFVAGIPANVTTGVLREHALRLNSSIECKEIDRASFPSPCPGEGPFSVTLQKANDTKIRVCVPGKVGNFPWTRSRNRQDLEEELYLDLLDDNDTGAGGIRNIKTISSTVQCTAKTTRGFFELGNTWNDNTYGSLLDQWPSRRPELEEFNDWVATSRGGDGFIPTELDNYDSESDLKPLNSESLSASWRVSGPLTISAIALFGNTSWLHNVFTYAQNMTYENADGGGDLSWRQICAAMPFANLDVNGGGGFRPATACAATDSSIAAGRNPAPWDLLMLVHGWIATLAPVKGGGELNMAESVFQVSMFTAHQAMLTFYSPNVMDRPSQASGDLGRTIYSSPGQILYKPAMSKASLILLSVLIALQLLGLAYLAYYIFHVPTWTAVLDAMATAQMGASLGQQNALAPIDSANINDHDILNDIDGLIGTVPVGRDDEKEGSRARLAPSVKSDNGVLDIELQEVNSKGPYVHVEQQTPDVQLGLGASGPIQPVHPKFGLTRRNQDKASV